MNELKTFCTYTGSRTYKTKEGNDGTIYKFSDDNGSPFEIMVLQPVNVEPGSRVVAYLLIGQKWNDDLKRYEKRYYFKSVEPAVLKK